LTQTKKKKIDIIGICIGIQILRANYTKILYCKYEFWVWLFVYLLISDIKV